MTGKDINNAFRIPCNIDTFFKMWLEFLHPFHEMPERVLEIASDILKKRYTLSKSISDVELLDTVLMNEDTKRQIRKECIISLSHFRVIMGILKKKGFIIDNKVNPKYIPNYRDEKEFKLMFLFDGLNELQGDNKTGS